MSIVDRLVSLHLAIFKGYRLLEKIAEGGMSTIYKAVSRETGEAVAIKILFPRYGKQKNKLQKLFVEKQVEGEMASSLNHPNVMKTFSYGRIRNLYYFVMEFIGGMNLKHIIYNKPEFLRGRKFDVIKQVGQGLNYIHSRGIIHRDMCPKNILVSENGQVKIIDFGLSISKSSRYRGIGERSGTPSYMAPEQIRALEADERTDIYAFGVTMYEILAESPPFGGQDSFARMQQQLSFEAVPLSKRIPDIPLALEGIVSRAMQKEPEDRYKSMNNLLHDFERIEFSESAL